MILVSFSEINSIQKLVKLHKAIHYSIEIGVALHLKKFVRGLPKKYPKTEANQCKVKIRGRKSKQVHHNKDYNDDDGHMVITIVSLTHESMTNKIKLTLPEECLKFKNYEFMAVQT